jgi:hypothetical protein
LATALAGLSACNLRHARASGCAFYFSNPKKSKKISMLWNFFYQPQYIVVSQEHNPGQLFSFFLKNSVWRGRFLSKKVPEFCKLQRSVHRNRKYDLESHETRSGRAR